MSEQDAVERFDEVPTEEELSDFIFPDEIGGVFTGELTWQRLAWMYLQVEQALEASQQEVEYYQTGIGLMQHHWISPQEYHEDFQKWQQEVERLRESADGFFEIIEAGNRAYPKDIFPEPPSGEHGKTVDACSAAMGRHIFSMLMDKWNATLGAALEQETQGE